MSDRPYNIENHRRWLREHAPERVCPPCAGRKSPLPERDCLVQGSMRCPTCRRVWIYRTQIERAVKQRRPWFYYAKRQPFLEGSSNDR